MSQMNPSQLSLTMTFPERDGPVQPQAPALASSLRDLRDWVQLCHRCADFATDPEEPDLQPSDGAIIRLDTRRRALPRK